MTILKKLQNQAYAAGVKHGRGIGVMQVEALLHAEIRALQVNTANYPDLEPRINELQFILAKIRKLDVK